MPALPSLLFLRTVARIRAAARCSAFCDLLLPAFAWTPLSLITTHTRDGFITCPAARLVSPPRRAQHRRTRYACRRADDARLVLSRAAIIAYIVIGYMYCCAHFCTYASSRGTARMVNGDMRSEHRWHAFKAAPRAAYTSGSGSSRIFAICARFARCNFRTRAPRAPRAINTT